MILYLFCCVSYRWCRRRDIYYEIGISLSVILMLKMTPNVSKKPYFNNKTDSYYIYQNKVYFSKEKRTILDDSSQYLTMGKKKRVFNIAIAA